MLIACLIVLCAAVLVWAFYFGLVTRVYRLRSPAIAKERSLRIAVVADLHSLYHGRNQRALMRKLHRQRPDVVVLAGDIIDDVIRPAGAISFLSQLGDWPTYYVPGNHEYKGGRIDACIELVKSFGITVLRDSFIEVDLNGSRLLIAGADDPQRKKYADPAYDYAAALSRAFSPVGHAAGERRFRILIAHNPFYISLYKRYPFDLVLSGHAHGGQVRIPLILNGLYNRSVGFFPKYAGGRYDHGACTHIVSRGASSVPVWCPRVFNPTELVIVEVSHGQAPGA